MLPRTDVICISSVRFKSSVLSWKPLWTRRAVARWGRRKPKMRLSTIRHDYSGRERDLRGCTETPSSGDYKCTFWRGFARSSGWNKCPLSRTIRRTSTIWNGRWWTKYWVAHPSLGDRHALHGAPCSARSFTWPARADRGACSRTICRRGASSIITSPCGGRRDSLKSSTTPCAPPPGRSAEKKSPDGRDPG